MNASDVYFKVMEKYELPLGILYYTFKDENGVIQVCGGSLWVRFEDHEENIKRMLETEKSDGFMFWNDSDEGKEFFYENSKVIGNCFSEMYF